MTELDRNQEGQQIVNNESDECRVYQPSFVRRDVHRYVLRNQYLPRCVEHAFKTRAFGCDDTCAAENG